MKLLWITNTIFPEVCTALNMPAPVIGGWMYASALEIMKSNRYITLAVATTYSGTEFKKFLINGITYYLLPESGDKEAYNLAFEPYWKQVKAEFKPTLIHIHGTEYSHGLAYIRACGNKGVVISIQGLVSVYARYYFGGIDEKQLRKNITIRDVIRRDTIFIQRDAFIIRGEIETQYINSVQDVIGRTSWDKVHVKAINPEVNYHFCNETLRNEFYVRDWSYNNCERHRIFLSQGHYPIKGLHQVIKALPLILKDYPNAKVYVGGNDILSNKGWRIGGFGKYVASLLKANNLQEVVVFTGLLTEIEIADQYSRANVFVCPSSIENSANSVGEAQLMGVPCVASFVGGTPDMISDGDTGLLYRYEEHEMLAECICKIFGDATLREKLSQSGKIAASHRHNKISNASKTNMIYDLLCKQ